MPVSDTGLGPLTHLKDHSILDHIQVESRWGYTGPVQQAVSLTVFIHYTLTSWAL